MDMNKIERLIDDIITFAKNEQTESSAWEHHAANQAARNLKEARTSLIAEIEKDGNEETEAQFRKMLYIDAPVQHKTIGTRSYMDIQPGDATRYNFTVINERENEVFIFDIDHQRSVRFYAHELRSFLSGEMTGVEIARLMEKWSSVGHGNYHYSNVILTLAAAAAIEDLDDIDFIKQSMGTIQSVLAKIANRKAEQ